MKEQADPELTLADLVRGLEFCFFEAKPDLPLRHRQRYMNAVGLICEYLDDAGAPDLIVLELQSLYIALDDLDRGAVWPCLQPVVPQNPIADPGDVWSYRSFVAAAVDLMVKSGMTEVFALAKLEQSHGSLRALLAPRASTLSGAAKEWRRTFRKGICKSVLAQRHFDRLPSRLEEGLSPDDCSQEAKQLLADVTGSCLAINRSQLSDADRVKIERFIRVNASAS